MLDARKVKAEKPRNIKRRNQKAIVALLQNNTEINSHKYLQPMVKQKSHTVIKSVHKNWLSMLLTKPHKKI